MRIGPQKILEQTSTLYDWAADCGDGLMHCLNNYLPEECKVFCFEQYDRFGVIRPPDDIVEAAMASTYWSVDVTDPYALLCGISDVEVTTDWREVTYEIVNDNGVVKEADPELLETFQYMPGQDEENFLKLMARSEHPDFKGVEDLPGFLGATVEETLAGCNDWDGPDGEGCVADQISEESHAWLNLQCRGADGILNEDRYKGFFRLAAWATFVWVTGPLGRSFRADTHEAFAIAYRDGQAVLYNGSFLDKKHYKVIPRLPQSCAYPGCGIDSWCVEEAHVGGVTRYLCEKHLNGSAPLYPKANCGSRLCKYVQCGYHPYYGKEDALHAMLRGRGQLSMMSKQTPVNLEGGPQTRRLL